MRFFFINLGLNTCMTYKKKSWSIFILDIWYVLYCKACYAKLHIWMLGIALWIKDTKNNRKHEAYKFFYEYNLQKDGVDCTYCFTKILLAATIYNWSYKAHM